jgi:hypothetical protein
MLYEMTARGIGLRKSYIGRLLTWDEYRTYFIVVNDRYPSMHEMGTTIGRERQKELSFLSNLFFSLVKKKKNLVYFIWNALMHG